MQILSIQLPKINQDKDQDGAMAKLILEKGRNRRLKYPVLLNISYWISGHLNNWDKESQIWGKLNCFRELRVVPNHWVCTIENVLMQLIMITYALYSHILFTVC